MARIYLLIYFWMLVHLSDAELTLEKPSSKNFTLIEGSEFVFECRSNQGLGACKVYFGDDENNGIKLFPGLINPDYSYSGEGLEKGWCGIKYHKIKAEHQGKVTCDVDGEKLQIDLTVNYPPKDGQVQILTNSQPYHEFNVSEFNEFIVTCTSKGGRPLVSRFEAKLGNEPMQQVSSNTTSAQFKTTLERKNCNNEFKCIASNSAWGKDVESLSFNIQLDFPPRLVEPRPKTKCMVNKMCKISAELQVGQKTSYYKWTDGQGNTLDGEGTPPIKAENTEPCVKTYGIEIFITEAHKDMVVELRLGESQENSKVEFSTAIELVDEKEKKHPENKAPEVGDNTNKVVESDSGWVTYLLVVIGIGAVLAAGGGVAYHFKDKILGYINQLRADNSPDQGQSRQNDSSGMPLKTIDAECL